MPLVTIVIPSHLKPMVAEAIDSVLAQTEKDWNLVIYDAGHWTIDPDSPMHQVYADYAKRDKRIEWIITWDGMDFRERYCPISYRYNQAVREGKVTGRYSVVLPDDDLLDPLYLEMLVEKLEQGHDAAYCSQTWVNYKDGITTPRGGLTASKVVTGDCVGNLDLLQVMWRTDVLKRLEAPYFPEDPRDESCRIQDGLFFNRLCSVTDGIYPVPDTLCTHRFNPQATYSPI
jgi:hypothetical protein